MAENPFSRKEDQHRLEETRAVGAFAHNHMSDFWNWYQKQVPKTKLRRFEWVLEFADPHEGRRSTL